MKYEDSRYGQKAGEYFKAGYNCSQSVVLAFEELYGIDREMVLKLSSSFGGGMGRLREVCGAVSGMLMVAGLLYGYDGPKDYEGKSEHYARVQELAKEYEKENGSIICRELLGLGKKRAQPQPEQRTDTYYKKRPCEQLVRMAAGIMEEYIQQNPIE